MTPTPPEVPEPPVRLFLVDDQELVRAGFAMVLDATPDMQVVGQAADGRAALDALTGPGRVAADVVLMDIQMPRLNGVEATRALLAEPGAPRVLVLTTFDLDEFAFAALQAGASGFLLKDAGPRDLLAAIRAVHRGDSVVAPSTTRRLIDTFVAREQPGTAADEPPYGDAGARLSPLTDREREVLVAVGRGLTNAEIAASFFLAEATVKTHIGAILRKLDLRDRVQMVVLAYETGLVRVGDE
ncbi:response regulator transcription factor [Lapillicoccus jejuensis]|uniref:LuxR family two component transcriptional regulator n=1 Tax=Lapillicoccus jejuensis TaxID=402171 RepID=A0A542E201_9MICO|nr:response regulator transcription factor [Lapillicoccus jejuensis]TQJ09372.1 LuxR family two component transcriptional regulator [Lapillicoccus jejuensis]